MPTSKQVALIIAGGWHKPESYTKLVGALEASGFEVHVPVHPSLNESRPPDADLHTDTANIRSYVEDILKDGHEVIVLLHSYGGQVGTNALHGLAIKDRAKSGLKGGVLNMIYMAACALPEGKAMIDMVRHFGHEDLMPLALDFAEDMSCVSRDPKMLLVGPDPSIAQEEVEAYLSTLVRWNGQCMYQPMTTDRAAWRDIPVTYIHTTKDMTIPMDYQKWLVEEVRKEGVVVQTASLETGHCPNLTAVAEVVSIMARVAKGEVLESQRDQYRETKSNDNIKDAILSIGDGR